MATSSSIAILNDDNTITGVYCHFDGYLNGVGKTLVEHYNTKEKVEKLISYGSISILDENIGDGIDFNDREKRIDNKQCLFYNRDRGEEKNITTTEDYDDFMDEMKEDFNYLFIDGRWVYDKGEVLEDLK
jgi:hypothetical protein